MEKVNGELPERKQKQKPVKKGHGIDFPLRVVAAVAAVLVWFVLSITQYPTVNKSISNVPLTLSLEGTIAKEKGLSALNFKSITVDVEIKGMNYVIGNYTSSDLVATVDVSKVTKEGQYDLDIDVKSSHASDSCTIVSVSPSKVTVDFDRITEKQFTLEAEAPNVTAAEGFTLKDSTVNPEVITLTGPENNLENIAKVTAKVNKTAKLTEDTNIKADEIVLYDKDGNGINDSAITRDENQTFNVNFIVYKKKTLRFKVDVAGAPDGFDVSAMPITYSLNEVTILTPKLNENATETVTLGTMPLSQMSLGKQETFDIPLSEGEVILSGESKVTVTVASTGYTTAIYKVSKIETKNKPSGKNVSIETVSLPAVTVIGPENEVGNLNESDLVATVDLAGTTNNGSYSKVATIKVTGHNKCWCFGTNEIQLVVSDPSSD